MINSSLPTPAQSESSAVEQAVSGSRMARGAVVLAGVAVIIVLGIWFAFYMLVFLQRAAP